MVSRSMLRSSSILYRNADRLAVGCFLAIGYLSLTPLPEIPNLPGNDKLHHLIAYVVLGFLATLSRQTGKTVLATLLAVIAYGGLIEIIQPYVNRYGEFNDFLAGGLGAVLGWLLAHGMTRRIKT